MADETVDVVETVNLEEPSITVEDVEAAALEVLPAEGAIVIEPIPNATEVAPVEPIPNATEVAPVELLIDVLAQSDLIAVADKVEVSATPMAPSDAEVQAVLETVAPGVFFRQRCSTGDITDTFVVGGVYAPGRQRWVQTPYFASAQEQAEAIKAAFN